MTEIKSIKSVEDWMSWRLDEDSISVENYNKPFTDKLGWGEKTDVLYSFLSIYALGLLAFYPDKFYKKGAVIFSRKKKLQRAYSGKYITGNYNNFSELNDFLESKGFIEHYFDIGNVIPIWPGGNVEKGTIQIYDLPEIYFSKKDNALWTKILCKEFDNINLDLVLNTAWLCSRKGEYTNNPAMFKFGSAEEFLDSVCGENDILYSKNVRQYLYSRFVERIVGIIERRTELIKKFFDDLL